MPYCDACHTQRAEEELREARLGASPESRRVCKGQPWCLRIARAQIKIGIDPVAVPSVPIFLEDPEPKP